MNALKEPQIHPHFIAFEYRQSELAAAPPLGELALSLARNVIPTTRHHLVYHEGVHVCHPKNQGLRIPGRWLIPMLTCMVPATFQPQPETFSHYNIAKSPLVRPPADLIATKGMQAVLGVLYGTSMRQGSSRKQQWVSGPTPVTPKELHATIAGLPQLERPVPVDGSGYIADLQEIYSAIFDKITGGELPRITCQTGYVAYQGPPRA